MHFKKQTDFEFRKLAIDMTQRRTETLLYRPTQNISLSSYNVKQIQEKLKSQIEDQKSRYNKLKIEYQSLQDQLQNEKERVFIQIYQFIEKKQSKLFTLFKIIPEQELKIFKQFMNDNASELKQNYETYKHWVSINSPNKLKQVRSLQKQIQAITLSWKQALEKVLKKEKQLQQLKELNRKYEERIQAEAQNRSWNQFTIQKTNLQNLSSNLQIQLNDQKKTNEQYAMVLNKMTSQNQSLKKNLYQVKVKNHLLQRNINQLSSEITKLKSTQKNSKQQSNSFQSKLKDLAASNQQLLTKIENQKCELLLIKKQHEAQLRNLIGKHSQEKQNQMSKHQQLLTQVNAKNSLLAKQKEDAEQKLTNIENQLQSLIAENILLQEDRNSGLQETEKRNYLKEIEDLKNELVQMNQDNKRRETESCQFIKKISDLHYNNQIKEKQILRLHQVFDWSQFQHSKQINLLQTEIKSFKKQLSEANDELQAKTQSLVQKHRCQLQNSEKRCNEILQEVIKDKNLVQEHYEKKFCQFKSQHQKIKTQILQQNQDKLSKQKNEFKKQHEKKMQEQSITLEAFFNQQSKTLKDQIESLNQKLSQTHLEIKTRAREQQKIILKVRVLEAMIFELEKSLSQKSAEIEKQKSTQDQLLKQNQVLLIKTQTLENQLNPLKNAYRQSFRVNEQIERINSLQQIIKRLQNLESQAIEAVTLMIRQIQSAAGDEQKNGKLQILKNSTSMKSLLNHLHFQVSRLIFSSKSEEYKIKKVDCELINFKQRSKELFRERKQSDGENRRLNQEKFQLLKSIEILPQKVCSLQKNQKQSQTEQEISRFGPEPSIKVQQFNQKKQVIQTFDLNFFYSHLAGQVLKHNSNSLEFVMKTIKQKTKKIVKSTELIYSKKLQSKNISKKIANQIDLQGKHSSKPKAFLVFFRSIQNQIFAIYCFKSQYCCAHAYLFNLNKLKVFQPVKNTSKEAYSEKNQGSIIQFGEGQIRIINGRPQVLRVNFDAMGEKYFDIDNSYQFTNHREQEIQIEDIELYKIQLSEGLNS